MRHVPAGEEATEETSLCETSAIRLGLHGVEGAEGAAVGLPLLFSASCGEPAETAREREREREAER
jgi:hypothetical protein